MPEGAGRRKDWAEPKFGEPQRENLRLVKNEVTNREVTQDFAEEQVIIESSPEVLSYRAGEELEMIADNGEPETWKVASFNPDEDEVFLVRAHDKSSPPSLEVMTTADLAIETASLPLVRAAGELWDDVLDNYADVLETEASSAKFRAEINRNKGRLLRQLAFEILRDHPEVEQSKNPENLTRILNKVLAQHLMAEAKKIGEHDSRHHEAQKLEAVTKYYTARGHLRDPESEGVLAQASTELLQAKIAVTASAANLNQKITFRRNPNEVEPYAQAQETSLESWNALKHKLQFAEQQLNYLPENSFRMLAISEDLEQAFIAANRADAELNTARLRAGLELGEKISKDDYLAWMNILREWANKPGAVAARAERQMAQKTTKPVRREPVFIDKPLPRTQKNPNPSGFGRFVDKVVGWLEF